MKNEDWHLIATLYETKNLTQAARQLYMTQPALTKRLKLIEKEIGHLIVARTNKGVSFTPAGEYLAHQAARFMDLFRETKEHLLKIDGTSLRLIKIASSSSFTKYFLPNILRAYNDLYPVVQFQVKVDVSSRISSYIQRGQADCGFIQGDNEHALNAHLYVREACYAVSYKAVSYEELPELYLIVHNMNEATNIAIFRWWKEHYSSFPPNIGMTVTSLDTALEMVTHRLGFCIVFSSFLPRLRKDLYFLPLYNLDGTPFSRNTWFIYPNESNENADTRRFVDFVRALDESQRANMPQADSI